MYYVYVLKSRGADWRYVGFTSDLQERLRDHNRGKVDSTRNYRPFQVASYIAVENRELALSLERYFKSGSGIAWMNKRLLSQ
ncbi:MAG: GIY-YIG nuclease family protein [Balneolaceae bacterium]